MSKRTQTNSGVKNPKDFWPTPQSEVDKLAAHLVPGVPYDEPCAGDGAIITALNMWGIPCAGAVDLFPRHPVVQFGDALAYQPKSGRIITNPPFRQRLLQPMLDLWIGFYDTWLLLPMDYAANVWTNPYMQHVDRILPLGRVSWLNNGVGGYENYAWYHFNAVRQGLILPRG